MREEKIIYQYPYPGNKWEVTYEPYGERKDWYENPIKPNGIGNTLQEAIENLQQ